MPDRSEGALPPRDPRHQGARRSRGFTLIEILVAVVLIALTVTLVMVRLQPDDRQTAREEAQRLALILQQARDEAIATGASIGWRGEPRGYGFLRRDAERRWQPLVTEDVFRARVLPEIVRIVDVEIAGHKARPEEMLVFSPSALNPPFRIVVAVNAHRFRVRSDNFAELVVENDE
jgi:general secretion pathway protein H